MSTQGSEWVYESILRLPFGWRVIRLKKKFQSRLGHQYKSPMLYRKVEIKPGTFQERYWPITYLKHYRGPND